MHNSIKLGMVAVLCAAAGLAEAATGAPKLRPHGQLKGGVTVAERAFGKLPDGREARLWRLTSPGGVILEVSDFGAKVVRAYVPDRHGNLADVMLGFDTPAEYVENQSIYFGTLVGRYANRIANGKLTVAGKEYQLPLNETTNGRNCSLHGGPQGWDSQLWQARPFKRADTAGVVFNLVSPDGDQGFPGRLTVRVTYTLSANNVWSVDYDATTDSDTVLNPSFHGFWNLAGGGSVLKHELTIFADSYMPTDTALIPTAIAPVAGTAFDFTSPHALDYCAERLQADSSLNCTGNWYDHNWVLRGKLGELKIAATLYEPVSGRELQIWTTEPGLQMYCGQGFPAGIKCKAGAKLVKNGGVVMEPQHYPDSPNHPDYPTTLLKPGEKFHSHSEYRFGTR